MGSLRVEMRIPGQGWKTLETLTEADPPASVSNNRPGGSYREIIVFQCLGDRSGVWRDRFGVDEEVCMATARVITSVLGFDRLAMLRSGDFYVTDIVTDRGIPATMRWTHEA